MNVEKINKLFNQDLVAVNMGLESFADNLKKEGARAIQVNWKPPAGGNAKMVALLAKLGR
jgi:FdrA protein